MKLQMMPRAPHKKSEVNRLRREGSIPAVLYVRGKEGETFSIKSTDFNAFLRNVKPGHLPTSIFTLTGENGQERRALVKDIQYKITTYDVIHLDFEELIDDVKINVKIPVECTGVLDCVGIKSAGGVLRQVIRHVRCRLLPQHLVQQFELNVKELNIKQSKRVSDIHIPENIRPLTGLNEIVAVIVKR